MSSNDILSAIQEQAQRHFVVDAIVKDYMQAVEEIINIPQLLEMLNIIIARKAVKAVLDEIILQSKIEFNYTEIQSMEEDISDEEVLENGLGLQNPGE